MKKDRAFILTKDPYDDFEILGTFLALKDFDFENEKEMFLDKSDRDDTYLEEKRFIEYMIDKKIIKRTDIDIIHLGDYGDEDIII